jgi:EAL domain-containing protein (putative c-di-GMP-specific phosphodiesterase class I)
MELEKEKKILDLIKKDMKENKISIAYQPVISTKNKKVCSLESLFRFNNSVLNCNLEKVINIANKHQILDTITKFIVKNIIQDFSNWKERKVINSDFTISFNVSSNQLTEEFLNYLIDSIKDTDIKSNNLILEIKQTKQLKESNSNILNRLNEEGFKIALDDINLGENSINDLIKLPYHMIKLDREFIKSVIDNKPMEKTLAETIIKLSKDSGFDVICNGIENLNQANIIKELNCDYQQGFLYSKPVLKHEIVDIIRKLEN